MSESGCLVSSSFSTVMVNDRVYTPKVSIETNQPHIDVIAVNESGHQSTVEKDQLDVGNTLSSFDNIDLSSSASIKANSVTIAQPPSSIVKNMYLVVTGNNFLVSAAAGTTDFLIDIGTDDGDNAVKTSVFDDGGGGEIHLIQGSSGTNNGSILAMNTVIPLLINYSYTRDKDIIDAINKQGYFRTGTAETLHVAIDGGIPAAGKGSLYNKGTSPRNLYINLSSSSASNKLLGANASAARALTLTTAAANSGASVIQHGNEGGTVTFKIVCDFQIIS